MALIITPSTTGGGTLSNWMIKTSAYTAASGDRIIANTTGGVFTITLPASPSVGDNVVIADYGGWATNNLTIARNGQTIENSATDLIADINDVTVTLVYTGTTWNASSTARPTEVASQTGNSGKYLTTNGIVTSWGTLATVATSGSYTDLSGRPTLATVATSGSYTDLTSKPTIDTLLPTQTGNSGKFLTTNATSSSWASITIDGLLPTQTGNSGKFLTTNATSSSWAAITIDGLLPSQTGNSGKYLTTNGTSSSWATVATGTTVSISNDVSTNSDGYYPLMATSTSGTLSTAYSSSTKMYFNPSTGQLNATNFSSLSDINKKSNVQTIEDALAKVCELRGVFFDWNDTGLRGTGVIAQETEKILPEVVSTNGSGEKTVIYGNIVGLLIEAIKELQDEIAELKGNTK